MLAIEFLNYFTEFIPDFKTRKYVLAVSGGMDSMLMLHLFKENNLEFCVAHCNYNLRGEESIGDEEFVKKICIENGIRCFVKQFDIKKEKEISNDGTQLIARRLRYDWFEEIRKELDYDFICTAHHQRDQVETLIQRFMLGAFPESMQGIKPISEKIIRPFLFIDYDTLLSYSVQYSVQYRTDSSNLSQNYTRNKIRQVILPELNNVFGANYQDQILGVASHYKAYYAFLNQQAQKLLVKRNHWHEINLNILRETNGNTAILYEMLKNYGFNWAQCENICSNLNRESGTVFESKDRAYQLFFNSNEMQLVPTPIHSFHQEFVLEGGDFNLKDALGNEIYFKIIERNAINEFKKGVLYMDFEFVKYKKLVIRNWNPADFFTPLGMAGRKSMSDFLKDSKISPVEKQNQLLFCEDEKVVGVLGSRIDDSYKITESTKWVLVIA